MEWRPKYIQMSTTALQTLLEDLSKRHSHFQSILCALGDIDDENSSYEKKFQLWNSVFNLKRVLRSKYVKDPTVLRFGSFISTDGVSLAATIQQRKSRDECNVTRIEDEMKFVRGKCR